MSKRLKDAAERARIRGLKAIFKKAVRLVSLNNQWIESDVAEEQKANRGVQRTVSLRVRNQRKPGYLSPAEKTIIRTPHAARTIAERKRLCTALAKLKCFSGLNPKIRARLVPVLRLLPLGPGRVIIKATDMPITMYFIIFGEIQMLKDNEVVAVYGPGERIGAVELLENTKRIYSYQSVSSCELLVCFDYDFDVILRPLMTKRWDDRKRALKALDYFEFLDKDQIIDACRFGTLQQYDPLETIYCGDKDNELKVHFVLSGECLILQCLNIETIMRKGKKFYQLSDADMDTSIMFKRDADSTYSNSVKVQNDSNFTLTGLVSNSSSSSDNDNKKRSSMRKMKLRDIERGCGLLKSAPTPIAHTRYLLRRSRISTHSYRKSETALATEDRDYEDRDEYDYDYENEDEGYFEDFWEDENVSVDISDSDYDFEIHSHIPSNLNLELDHHSNITDIYTVSSSSESESSESSDDRVSLRRDSLANYKVVDIQSHFIDVGTLTFGGIFGLGENMKHRVIMARNTVQCLALPRFFLFQPKQNPGNIWERRLFYMHGLIPSREALFDHFLKTLEWKKFKNDFIRKSLPRNSVDRGHINDVPIICRIVEKSEEIY